MPKILKRLSTEKTKFASKAAGVFERIAYAPFFDYPFGRTARATADQYRDLWGETKVREYPVVDEYEKRSGFVLDQQWLDDLALVTQIVVKKSQLCYQHGRLLYSTLRKYISDKSPDYVNILETGTARGFSALCMAKALQDQGLHGKIVTFDLLPHDVPMLWNCIGDESGPRSRGQLLEDYQKLIEKFIIFHQGDTVRELKKICLTRVNMAFLDGAHVYPAVMAEFETIRHLQQSGDLIFFDDYTPDQFPGVVQAVEEICSSFGYRKEIVRISGERGYAIGTKE